MSPDPSIFQHLPSNLTFLTWIDPTYTICETICVFECFGGLAFIFAGGGDDIGPMDVDDGLCDHIPSCIFGGNGLEQDFFHG